jgi:hypothetical protein
VEGSRASLQLLARGLFWELQKKLTPVLALPKEWVVVVGSQVGVNRAVAREQEVEAEAILEVVERYLERQPPIAEVWTVAELERSDGELARLYRNSRDPERSGELLIQLEPTCLISAFVHGTTHGSPYPYDRAVPILFWGPGIEAGRVSGPAATIDIAPTLARRIGLAPPADLDGRPLLD